MRFLTLILLYSTQGSFSSEVELLLLTGTTCENLSCIASFYSEQSWKIRGGEKFWLALKFYRGGHDRGSYGLNLEEIDCIDHDVCESGKLISELPAIEQTSNVVLTSARFDRNGTVVPSLCQVLGNRYGNFRTLWYEVTSVKVGCMSAKVLGTSEISLGIHEGDSCDNMGCVTMASDYSSVSASWRTEPGTTYHIGVGAYGENEITLLQFSGGQRFTGNGKPGIGPSPSTERLKLHKQIMWLWRKRPETLVRD